MASIRPEDPLEKLRRLVEREWDDDDRVSVVIHAAPERPKTSLLPGVPPKVKGLVILVVTLVGAALAGAKMVYDMVK